MRPQWLVVMFCVIIPVYKLHLGEIFDAIIIKFVSITAIN
jgi:hypothetical protein